VWLAGVCRRTAKGNNGAAQKKRDKRGNEALAFAFKARQRTLKKISKKRVVKYVYFFMPFLLLLTVEVDGCHRAS